MTRLSTFALLVLLCTSTRAIAQESETILSDRPGQGNSPYALAKGAAQVQSGYSWFGTEMPTSTFRARTFDHALRFGLSGKKEIGLAFANTWETETIDGVTQSNTGLSYLALRFRGNTSQADGWKPAIGYEAELSAPLSNSDVGQGHPGFSFRVMTYQQPLDRVSIASNIGVSAGEPGELPALFYNINVGYAVGSFGGFVEYYATAQASSYGGKLDAGLAWLVTNNLQLDIFAGYVEPDNNKEWFVSSGISWRLVPKT